MTIDRYRPDDRRALDALYRRVFGADAADSSRLRWDWQYRRNPYTPAEGPIIWVAREGPSVIGQYTTMPVRAMVRGREIDASWGMDVMVAPERQRQGLGEQLFLAWDRHTGASLGLGLSDSSHKLFQKLRWPDLGPVPCLIKPLTRRALRRPGWPDPVNRLVSAVTLPVVKIASRTRGPSSDMEMTRRFDDSITALWERNASKFAFIVRRDAEYLNWKYIEPPHVRYNTAVLRRGDDAAGWAVYRHVREPRGRVTQLVDFFADPDDQASFRALLWWIDREARAADSDKIRCFATHEGFRRRMRRAGYFRVKSTVEFTAKINAVECNPAFYRRCGDWHVTLGDSDQDR